MGADERMAMEKCLTKNYLLAKGMNYFGKRDLIYLDMRGQDEIDRMYSKEYTPPVTDGGDDEWTFVNDLIYLFSTYLKL